MAVRIMKFVLIGLLLFKCVLGQFRQDTEFTRAISCFQCNWPGREDCRVVNTNTPKCTNVVSCYKTVVTDMDGRTLSIGRGCYGLVGSHADCKLQIWATSVKQCYHCSDRHYCNGANRTKLANQFILYIAALVNIIFFVNL